MHLQCHKNHGVRHRPQRLSSLHGPPAMALLSNPSTFPYQQMTPSELLEERISCQQPVRFEYTPLPLHERYLQCQTSAEGFVAYVVFAGHECGVLYNWNATRFVTASYGVNACFKGFFTHEEACRAWKHFVTLDILPADIVIGLGKPPCARPIPPPYMEPTISGLHPQQPPGPFSLSPSPLIHSLPHPHGESVYHQSFSPCTPAPQPLAYPFPSGLNSTPPTMPHASTSSFSQSNLMNDSVQATLLAPASMFDATPIDEQYFVVIVGQSPGVYLGNRRGEVGLGMHDTARYMIAHTLVEANALFAYMSRYILRISDSK
ncbi:hypothetical protein BDN70DRAFT_939221 [Pholiota conissans]|uniref:Uncharacterized protein n=1 Tax=Pholiota conissans TaxID=109636 RepID=A0A9P6CRF1_9AGAR|nr:hypothetical protein BDN70DRAFT_939221 [Pholiota conissans]